MHKEHVVILLVGRTNSGKTSLIKQLCERTGLRQLVSHTTRPPRKDKDDDHIFVNVEDYLKAKENDEIAAETEIAGNYYYATKEQLYNADLYTIDPVGRIGLLAMNLPNIRFVTVYISCPDAERERRAHKRGDDRNTYRVRDFAEKQQFRHFVTNEQWDYAICNQDFAKAYSCLRWISQMEGCWKNSKEIGDENNM